MTRGDIRWLVAKEARAEIRATIERDIGRARYDEMVVAFQDVVTAYIEAFRTCGTGLGSTISPKGGSSSGGKLFKIRVAAPGAGKSGGVRAVVSMHCDRGEVRVLMARWRRDELPNTLFDEAVERDW